MPERESRRRQARPAPWASRPRQHRPRRGPSPGISRSRPLPRVGWAPGCGSGCSPASASGIASGRMTSRSWPYTTTTGCAGSNCGPDSSPGRRGSCATSWPRPTCSRCSKRSCGPEPDSSPTLRPPPAGASLPVPRAADAAVHAGGDRASGRRPFPAMARVASAPSTLRACPVGLAGDRATSAVLGQSAFRRALAHQWSLLEGGPGTLGRVELRRLACA